MPIAPIRIMEPFVILMERSAKTSRDRTRVHSLTYLKPRMDIDLSRSYPDTWKAMEDMVDKGKTRLIGRD